MPSYLRIEERTNLASAQSIGASFSSDKLAVGSFEGIAIDARWSGGGTPIGTLKVQVSNDPESTADASIVWTDYTGSSLSVSGNSGSIMYDIAPHNFNLIRVVYTRTSGSASMDIIVNRRSRRS